MKVITLGLLAGAYRGQRLNLEHTLTHSVDARFDGGGDGYTLCGAIKADHLVDSGGMDDPENEKPTCKSCLRRDPRFHP